MKEKMQKILGFIKRNKVTTKVISFVLSLVLIFYVIPSSIYSEASELFDNDRSEFVTDTESNTSMNAATDSSSRDILLVTHEDESLREETVKHFHLADGTYIAAQYAVPVHYMDENGNWADIDNALKDFGSEYANNNARIKFAKKITGNDSLFTLHDENTKITLSLIGANKGTAGSVTNNNDSSEDTELQKMMNLEKLSSSILYKDILDGVDLEYVASSMNVKENIIVKEKKDSYTYSFELKLNGLTAELTESGDIQIVDESGTIKYTIPAPVVFDSNGAYAPADMASYTLEYKNGKKYILSVSVNSAWMNSEERVFPITVDPAIVCGDATLIDTHILSTAPSLSGNSSSYICASDKYIAYIKSTSLPSIPKSAYISNAQISFLVKIATYEAYIGAYEVLSYWDSSITWSSHSSSGVGQVGEDIIDYHLVDSAKRYTWDITSVAKKWYEGYNNYGIAFKSFSSGTKIIFFYSSEHTTSENRPTLTIEYKDIKGIENYWSYSSHSAGLAGNGSLNLANGNLVFSIPTLTTTDGLFGYTSTLHYNSALAFKTYTYGHTKSAYTDIFTPNGFKLSMCETIVEEDYTISPSQTETQFIHADADGTEHSYLPSGTSGVYYDEDALGKVMTVEANKIEITDDSHIIKRFYKMSSTPHERVKSAWYLKEIEDIAGNKLIFDIDTVSYRPTRILLAPKNVTNIELLRFIYVDDMLSAVFNDMSNDCVIFKYASNRLVRVEYGYGNYSLTESELRDYCSGIESANLTIFATANYTYNTSGMITSVTDNDSGKKISYTITSGKITTLSEYSGSTLGQQISFTYGEKYTDVRKTGNDEILGSNDDIITKYVFDKYGRAVSCYSSLYGSKEILGATQGTYDTQSFSKNSLVEQISLNSINQNLLKNGDFQQYVTEASGTAITNWTKSSNVTKNMIDGIGAVMPSSISFSPTTSSNAYVYQNATLSPDDYTLSVHYSSTNSTNVEGYAQIINIATNDVIASVKLNLSDQAVTKTEYTTLSFSLAASTRVTVKLVFSATGTTSSALNISAGMVKLEKGNTATDYTLLDNGSFESSTGWSTNSGTAITRVTDTDTYLKISANGTGNNYVKKTVYSATADMLAYANASTPISNPNYKFAISGFAKGVDVVSSKPFRLRVDITYYYGADQSDVTVSHYYDFIPGCSEWQFISGTFTLNKYSDGSELPVYKCVKSVVVYCDFSSQIYGYALFDDIALSYIGLEKQNQNTYDDKGKTVIVALGNHIEYYEYNEHGNVSRMANSLGELVDYAYSSENPHLLLSTTVYDYSYNGDASVYPYGEENIDALITKVPRFQTVYNYNQYHLIVNILQKTPSSSSDDGWETASTISYTYMLSNASPLFGLMTSETNSNNNKTQYFYDQNKGLLLAAIDISSGTGYSYTYDARGRLIGVTPATYTVNSGSFVKVTNAENVEYSYDALNRLNTISTESTVYTFHYDVYGNSSKVEAGSNTLAEYTYNPNNGKLNKITYGNGFYVDYVYDEKEQLTEVKYNGVVRYKYEYTSDGQVYKITNQHTGTTVVYYYDSENRFAGFREYITSTGEADIISNITYDENSFITGIRYDYIYRCGSSKITDSSIYSCTYRIDGALTAESIYSNGSTYNISYTYDYLDRISHAVYNVDGAGFSNTVDYTYRVSENGETGLVEKHTSTVGSTATTYSYTYDADGNITRILYNTGQQIRYYYDDLNQLIREDNTLKNATYIYSYDNAGNIIEKTEYNLTAANQTPTVAKSYNELCYSNSDWGDLLVGVNGVAITYDNIGNPTSYYNDFVFDWDGRQLVTAERGYLSYYFKYSDNGLRTEKITSYFRYDDTPTTYSYSGTLLVKEESPEYTIVYLYDANGSPIGFKYRTPSYAEDVWDEYFYEKNLQNDVVAIYNASGTKLISYIYDAWGNFTTSYHNGGADTSVVNNPYTYRGYYYDYDLGLYYLQSRYYDPNTCRFINADDISVIGATPSSLTDKNLFSYCDNNPVMRVDHGGHFWGTIFDVISLGISIVDVINNPDDVWAWIGLAGDVVDLLPIVSGVGEATDLLRIANKADNFIYVAGTVHDTLKITDGSIDTYKNLKKINKGNGLEVHHIVEKRFAGILKINQNEMLSIALTHNEHVVFTRAWRKAIPYGKTPEIDDIWKAAQEIYINNSALLEAVRKTLWR